MITIEQATIFLFISIALAFLFAILYMRRMSINDTRRVQIEDFESKSSFNTEAILINTLDSVIQSVFDNYVLVEIEANTSFKATPTIEIDVTEKVTTLVLDMISPTLLNNLSVVYNKDRIGKLISDRTYMQVFAYFASKKNKV